MNKISVMHIVKTFVKNLLSPLNIFTILLLVVNILNKYWAGVIMCGVASLSICLGIVLDLLKNDVTLSKRVLSYETFAVIIAVIIIALQTVVFSVVDRYQIGKSILLSISHAGSMLPLGIALLIKIVELIYTKHLRKEGIKVQNFSSLDKLRYFDVVIFGKNKVLTDGTKHLKLIEPLNNQNETQLKQIIANVLNSAHVNNPDLLTLRNDVIFDSTLKANKSIIYTDDRKYMAVEFGSRGTYLLGNIEAINITNKAGISYRAKEYLDKGYTVLLLAHSLFPISGDSFNNKADGVALVVLEDTLREGALTFVQRLYKYHKEIKIMSSENPKDVSELGRSLGITEADKYVSLDGKNDAEVAHLAKNCSIFGDCTEEQKEFIVRSLQAEGKRVLVIGNEYEDDLMIKASDCSIATHDANVAVKANADYVMMRPDFDTTRFLLKYSRKTLTDIIRIMILEFSKMCFAAIFMMFGGVMRLFHINGFADLLSPSYLYLWELFLIFVPSVALLFENNTDSKFFVTKTTMFTKIILNTIFMSLFFITMYVLMSLRNQMIIYDGFESGELLVNQLVVMSAFLFLMFALIMFFEICLPLTKYRRVTIFLVWLVYIVIAALESIFSYLGMNNLVFVLKDTNLLTWNSWIIIIVVLLIGTATYLFVSFIVDHIISRKEGR